ncbi:MAG TPA: hypothetical protein VFM18_18725 [Methanosarcina sp.]|nr:hypothetical protein [Methanosarcina sp.]
MASPKRIIPLPPGCKVSYEIRFFVDTISDEMYDWFKTIGGTTTVVKGKTPWINSEDYQVQYGKAKPSYVTQDGAGTTLIRFTSEDASVASMFYIKFMDHVQTHNFKEMMEQYEQ